MGTTRLAFIRGINVGGHNKVPMAELRGVLTDAGLADVRTYIQSGNVVYTAPDGADDSPATLRNEGASISDAIEARWGFATPVTVRTAGAVTSAVARSPFADADPARAFLFFGDDELPSVDDLASDASAGEQWQEDDDVIHVLFPKGIGGSKLGAKLLKGSLTSRNLRTIRAVLELAG